MKVICEKSLSGKIWNLKGASDGDILDSILSGRGLLTEESKQKFLNPTLRETMPDPFVLKGMEAAVKIAADKVLAKKKIAVFGDYDVDGITAVAILVKYFKKIGADIMWHLPDRESEGYGLKIDAIKNFHEAGAELIITVDCGITAVDEVEYAASLGMSVIITDHHEPGPKIPGAAAVINPKQDNCESDLCYLAGVGVAFMFLVALNRELGRPVPSMLEFLDLVAIGTVCDTMPLVGLNRAITASGIRVLEKRGNLGLAILMEAANVKSPDVYAMGFVIGPRLNAAGRMQDATLALDLILSDNEIMARELAERLNNMNANRQTVQSAIMIDADEMAKKQMEAGKYSLFIAGDNWHGGVLGIIAGRLKEKYNRPTAVVTRENGVLSGSGRSVSSVDLGSIIHSALEAGMLTAGGGHAAAAGFELSAEHEENFKEFFENSVKEQLGGSYPVLKIDVDVEMDAGGATLEFAESLSKMAPFGMGNPEPVLALSGGLWNNARRMGQGGEHLSGTLKTSQGNVSVVGFNMSDTDIGRFLLDSANYGTKIMVAGKIKKNSWNGTDSVQIILEDIAL